MSTISYGRRQVLILVLTVAATNAAAQNAPQDALGSALAAPVQSKVATPAPIATVKTGSASGPQSQPTELEDIDWAPNDPCVPAGRGVSSINLAAGQARANSAGDSSQKAQAYLASMPNRYREGLLAAARLAIPSGLTFPLNYKKPSDLESGNYADASELLTMIAGGAANPPTLYVRPILQRGGTAEEVVSAMIANHYFWRSPEPDPKTAKFVQGVNGNAQIDVGLRSGGPLSLYLPELEGFFSQAQFVALPTFQEVNPTLGVRCSK